MTEIRIPKLNANDAAYTLVEWLVADGSRVAAGDPVVVVETAKATEELESPADGYLRQAAAVGAECPVGAVIGTLSEVAAPPAATPPSAPVPAYEDVIITGPAAELMARHGVDRAAVLALGRRLIRTADIEELLAGGRVVALGRHQEAVAAAVTESHRTIPAAFVAVAVDVDGALALARTLTRAHKRLVGLAELLVKAVAVQLDEHPLCFGSFQSPAAVRVPDAADVGVTIDVGTGLHVPVVRDPAALDWRELAGALMGLRLTAMKGGFAARDLAGAHILVALHNDAAVTVAVPMVFPGQACAVSLGAVQQVIDLDADGSPVRRSTVQIGLAYDHRVVNGRGAVAFLAAVKALLEDPERLAGLGTTATGTAEPQGCGNRAAGRSAAASSRA
ncbi:2-oxo acid dehydrogenase subunit E2 [Luedemannella helvata]|uniref:2-oxo acid dehydrogenase subunit E2 n=1 Tax=Luedemannella helvata TaxID=349315 RepID=UPI0031E16423